MTYGLYFVLGVAHDASDEEIKKAYRKLSLKWHPDRNSSPNANKMFQDINYAYTTLSNPKLRKIHDLKGQAGLDEELNRTERPSFSTMWNNIWNMRSAPKTTPPPQPNIDIKIYYDDTQTFNVSLSISIKDLKQMIFERFGVSVEKQVLKFGGKELTNGQLSDYRIRNGSSVFLDSR